MFLKRIFEEVPVVTAEPEKPRPWEQKVVSIAAFLTRVEKNHVGLCHAGLASHNKAEILVQCGFYLRDCWRDQSNFLLQ